MKKLLVIISLIFVLNGALLQAHSLNLKIGLFKPALNSDLWEINIENLAFDKRDMMDMYFGAEYEFFLNKVVSLAFEGGFYQKTVYSLYKDWEYEDGTPIYQNLSLSIYSFELNFKLYPLGNRKGFFPFLGAGAGIYAWQYEQWGDFINFEDMSVTQDVYADTDTIDLGFNAKAGIGYRFNRIVGIIFEAKYQYIRGQLSSFFEGFEKLDIGGLTFNLGLNILLWR